MNATVSWSDIPAATVITLLGDDGRGFHPRDIWDPQEISQRFSVPLELLPVSELKADEAAGVVLYREGKRVQFMQGVVAGDLIDAVAEGLGVEIPADAPRGYSGSRIAIAAAIVKRLKKTCLGHEGSC